MNVLGIGPAGLKTLCCPLDVPDYLDHSALRRPGASDYHALPTKTEYVRNLPDRSERIRCAWNTAPRSV
jgi:hypothetical protein